MIEKLETVDSRRDFLKKAGKASVAAPAVAILLSSTTQAQEIPNNIYFQQDPQED